MKSLIEHLLRNNLQEIVSKSLLNCHTEGVHSIMLLDSPGKTIRLFVAEDGNDLYQNFPPQKGVFDFKTSIAFHPHHCNLTLHVVKGKILNWIICPDENGISVGRWLYQSPITGYKGFFKRDGSARMGSKASRWINQGESISLAASDIHTIATPIMEVCAWLVFEGIEDANYKPHCFTNTDLSKADFDNLYKKTTESDITRLLTIAGLF